jgi:hypothetical protein
MRWLVTHCLLLLAGLGPVATAMPDRHFVDWFPAYAPVFQKIARDNCSVQISNYHQGHSPLCPSYAEWPQCIPGYAIDCIMDHVGEFNKANLAAAGVVLGILPTILSLAGTSTAALGLLAMRRPFLAALLVAGAPVVSPIRSSDFADPARVLTVDYGHAVSGVSRLGGNWARLLVCVEYLLATGAAANLILLSYELGVKGVCSFSTDTVFQPLLWALLAMPIHLVGAAALRLRVRIVDAKQTSHGIIRNEFGLCMSQPAAHLRLEKRTLLFVFISWFISIGTIIHMIYGTLVLSSTMFVATADALILATRYFASTIVCRAISAFELGGMATRVKVEEQPLCEPAGTAQEKK